MTLRNQIEKRLRQFPNDSAAAAIEICKLLDEKLSLSGNGWFDDDEVMLIALGKE